MLRLKAGVTTVWLNTTLAGVCVCGSLPILHGGDQWVPSPAPVKLRTAGISDWLGRGLSGEVARKNDLLLLHGFRSQATHDHDASAG